MSAPGRHGRTTMAVRLVVGAAGIMLAVYGAWQIVEAPVVGNPTYLLRWLVGAVVLHDAIIAPSTVAFGWLTSRVVPPHARRYVYVALFSAASATLIALPQIYRRGSQPAGKALLRQDYGLHLVVVIAIIVVLTGAACAGHAVWSRRRSRRVQSTETDTD